MKGIKRRTLLPLAIFFVGACISRAEHPRVLATPTDRETVRARVETCPWAKEAYGTIKARVDDCLEHTRTNPAYLSSRLFLHWTNHYSTAVVEKSRWVRG